jgi:hypothetical protein
MGAFIDVSTNFQDGLAISMYQLSIRARTPTQNINGIAPI